VYISVKVRNIEEFKGALLSIIEKTDQKLTSISCAGTAGKQ